MFQNAVNDQEENDVVKAPDQIEVLGNLHEIVDALLAVIIRTAQSVGMAGVDIELFVQCGIVCTSQKQYTVKGNVADGDGIPLKVLQRVESRVGFQRLHDLQQRIGNALIVDVHLQLFIQIGGKDQRLKGGLPRCDLVSLGVFCIVVEIKDALLLQIAHIATDLVKTAVQIVAAVIGRVQ